MQPTRRRNKSTYYNIYGHTPVDYVNPKKYRKNRGITHNPEPEFYDGACNIDTGCAYNTPTRGYLTGVFFPSLEIKQVKLKEIKRISDAIQDEEEKLKDVPKDK